MESTLQHHPLNIFTPSPSPAFFLCKQTLKVQFALELGLGFWWMSRKHFLLPPKPIRAHYYKYAQLRWKKMQGMIFGQLKISVFYLLPIFRHHLYHHIPQCTGWLTDWLSLSRLKLRLRGKKEKTSPGGKLREGGRGKKILYNQANISAWSHFWGVVNLPAETRGKKARGF